MASISIQTFLAQNLPLEMALQHLCDQIYKHNTHYDWVGFYWAHHASQQLYLGSFTGETTDHKIIPFGKGICGQVAVSGQTFVVPDVHAQSNYLSCNALVKSEIVIPIILNGHNIGQLDIDSHTSNAFSTSDEADLQGIIHKFLTIYDASQWHNYIEKVIVQYT